MKSRSERPESEESDILRTVSRDVLQWMMNVILLERKVQPVQPIGAQKQ